MARKELKGLVLFSGGFDSAALTEYIMSQNRYDEIYLLYIEYGNVNRLAELEAVHEFSRYLNYAGYHGKVTLKFHKMNAVSNSSTTMGGESTGDEKKDEYVPMRNMQFLSIAAAYAELLDARDIYIGVIDNLSNHYPDTSSLFIQNMNQLVGGMTGGMKQVFAPFVHYDKYDIARVIFEQCGHDSLMFIVENAITCNVTTSTTNCGECNSCLYYEELKNYCASLL